MSSLVDQFLADDNEELQQYTQPIAEAKTVNSNLFSQNQFEGKRTEQTKNAMLNNYTSELNESDSEDEKAGSSNLNSQQRQGSSLSNAVGGQSSQGNSANTANRKQLLQDFKRKYNFYNDTSSEEEQDPEEEDRDDEDQEQNDGNSDAADEQQNQATENEGEEEEEEQRSDQESEANADNDQSEVEEEEPNESDSDNQDEDYRASQILKEASNLKLNSNQCSQKIGESLNKTLPDSQELGFSQINSASSQTKSNQTQNMIGQGVGTEEQKTKKQMSALEELRRKYQFSSSDEEDDDFWKKKPSQMNQSLKPQQKQMAEKGEDEETESDQDQIKSPAFKSIQFLEENQSDALQTSSSQSQQRKEPEQSVKSSLQNFLQQQRASYHSQTNKSTHLQSSRKISSESDDDSQSFDQYQTQNKQNQQQKQSSLEEEQRRRYEEREKEREIALQQQRQKMLELQQQQLMSLRSKVNFDSVNDNLQKEEDRKQIVHQDNTSDSESDFYQLSEMHDSQRPSSAQILPEENRKEQQQYKDQENELTFSQMQFQNIQEKDQVKIQIAQMNQLIDSSIQNYDQLLQVHPPLTERSQAQGRPQEKNFHFKTEESVNQSEPLVRNQNFINNEKRQDQEMTFNDLSDITSSSNYQLSDSAASSYQDAQALKNALSVKKQQSQLIKQQPPIHQSVIKEEDLEESQLLNDSQLSQSQNLNYLEHGLRNFDIHEGRKNEEKQASSYLQSKLMNLKQATGSQYFQMSNEPISQSSDLVLKQNYQPSSQKIHSKQSEDERIMRARKMILKHLIVGKERAEKAKALQVFKENKIVAFYQVKLQNAAMMVDKMSKFSRSFISLNSLSQIINKNRLRLQAKAFSRWNLNQSAQNQKAQSNDAKIQELETQLQQKDEEIAKMETMFREYSSWKNKLEQIEQKMKSDCDYWKSSCEKMQRENEKLQREAIKLTQSLIESKKDTEAKVATIESLQKKLKAANVKAAAAQLDTVEEVVCPNCKNSLEESQIFTGRASTARRENSDEKSQVARQEQQMQMIQDLSSKLSELEKQVMLYRERVHYHESMEEELKRNIEQQVDVVLKMEEERLLLLRDSKEIKDRNEKLQRENDDFRAKVGEFEKELEDLQTLINEQQQEMKRQRDSEKNQDESLLNEDGVTEGVKIGVNKENKSSNLKKKTTLTQKPKAKKSQGLKFQAAGPFKVGENSAIFSSSVKQQLQSDSSMMTNSVQMTDTSMISATASTFGSGKSKYGQEPINKQLVTDNQLLTNELVMMGRELTKLKSELRGTQDQLKKTEKERYELRKNLDGKETAVEKLRKERDELWAVVNTDKYKNIKVIEQEKEKIEKGRLEAENQLSSLREELEKVAKESDSLRLNLEELEFSTSKMKEKEAQREKLLESLEERARKSEIELSHQRQSTQTLLDELDQTRAEGAKLKKDVEWLANSAKNNKLQAERAISDLESYTKILRGMEKKMAEVEVEKESKEAELKEMKIKIAAIQQIQQQQTMQQQIQVQVPHPQQINLPSNYNQMPPQIPLTNQFILQQQQYQVKQNPNGNFNPGVGNMLQQQPVYQHQYAQYQQPQFMNSQMRQVPINQNQTQQTPGQSQNYGIQKATQNPQGQAPRVGAPQPQQPPQRFQ